ncbi:MAG: hydrolase, partial [Cyclobacteriaceae bacterium]|nr:hydrolase [Cyclobacteriaceae bacterium]
QPWGNFAMGFEMNDIKLGDPYGSARLWLINPKFELNFTNNLFWTTFLQYNTQADNFNINSRIQWRYRPMSDVFLVYTDNYLTEGNFGPKNRAIVLKFNYFFQL